jgi:elongation factor G
VALEPDKIRNVVLVGHSGSGKTSLTEALLFAAGVTTRLGTVEDGNTITDFEPEEVDRTVSINLGNASFGWNGHKVNVIDTPGYADFIGEVHAGLRAADLALFVVSAVDGIEVQTEIAWSIAAEEGIARAIFVNKLDRERSDFRKVLDDLKAAFGTGVAPVEMPIGSEADLRGVAGIVSNHAFLYDSDDPKGNEVEIPDEVKGDVEQVRTALVEAVVENDDAMLEAYLEGKEPDQDQLVKGLREGILEGNIFPVLCGSATALIGIDRLAELILRDGPSPLERPSPPVTEGPEPTADPSGPANAYVFKTVSDPYVGRISMFRLFSGSIKLDDVLENSVTGSSGRMHNLFYMSGKDHTDTKDVPFGDIAAVAKLETVLSGNTLRSPGSETVIEPVEVPNPNMSLAVFPKTTHDDEKLSTALQKSADEDPTLRVERRGETNQTIISGLGDTHLDVTIDRMSRKYGVEVTTDTPKVPYRETITASADAEGKHKKQSGGRGQFGVAFVKFEPLPAGSGYEFVDAIKGGSIPRQLIPAVDKGVREALERGMLAGYPVTDIRATVYDGKYHAVDSDELSFRMAGIQAVRAAATDLRPVLLEPYDTVQVIVPEEYMGDIIGDLNSKRGRVGGMDSAGTMRVVTAEVPLAEMQHYTIDLRSITGGRGTFSMEYSHYEQVPPQETQKIVAEASSAEED